MLSLEPFFRILSNHKLNETEPVAKIKSGLYDKASDSFSNLP